MRTEHLAAHVEASLYSELVHAGQQGLVELVTAKRLPDGALRMRSRSNPAGYLEAGDARALAVGLGQARRRREEAFTSPLARPVPVAGKKAVVRGQVAWCDLDEAGSEPDWPGWLRPSLLVCSGHGLHAYWRLDGEVSAAVIESINRRLAGRFGGDLACTDRGRIMRLPGSFNGKRGAWCAIRRADLTARPLVEHVVGVLPDPDPPRPPRRKRFVARADDELATLAPPRYFDLLCGVDVPDRGGYVLCPIHEESTPSCRVWPEPDQGWWCFGCARGGGIYDLASLLDGGPWGRELAGASFIAVRDRLRERTASAA